MPTYVYRCEQCSAVIERRQRFSDAPLTECEGCAGTLRRVLQPVGIIFKGSGFYSTDYKVGAKSTDVEPKAEAAEPAKSSASSDSESAAPAKTPTSTEAKPAATSSTSTAKTDS